MEDIIIVAKKHVITFPMKLHNLKPEDIKMVKPLIS